MAAKDILDELCEAVSSVCYRFVPASSDDPLAGFKDKEAVLRNLPAAKGGFKIAKFSASSATEPKIYTCQPLLDKFASIFDKKRDGLRKAFLSGEGAHLYAISVAMPDDKQLWRYSNTDRISDIKVEEFGFDGFVGGQQRVPRDVYFAFIDGQNKFLKIGNRVWVNRFNRPVGKLDLRRGYRCAEFKKGFESDVNFYVVVDATTGRSTGSDHSALIYAYLDQQSAQNFIDTRLKQGKIDHYRPDTQFRIDQYGFVDWA